MYRTLLAQATPLPADSICEERQGDGDIGKQELANERREIKEQFEAYRKEKATNDKMMMSQVDEMKDQCSQLRLESAKAVSKVPLALLGCL